MTSLRESLPRPSVQSNDPPSVKTNDSPAAFSSAPSYLARSGFLPKSAVHFADGGAYPEIHVAQYPPGLGLVSSIKGVAKSSVSGGVATVTVTSSGDANFDSIVSEGIGRDKIVHTKHAEVVPKPLNVREKFKLFPYPNCS